MKTLKSVKISIAQIVLSGFLAVSLITVHEVANAWDGIVDAAIKQIHVAPGSNFGLRIYLNGVASMCSGGPDWAYLNDTDSNYKTYAAALMMAKAQGFSVSVYSNRQGPYCQIGYVAVH